MKKLLVGIFALGIAGLVYAACAPDLIVTSVGYLNSAFSSVVKNRGTTATASGVNITTTYTVNGVQRATGSVAGPLAAGASVAVGSTAYTIPGGTYTVIASADSPISLISESQENNNQRSKTITVATVVSADGATIPPETQLVDTVGASWTVSGGVIFRNGVQVESSNVDLMLFYQQEIYQRNTLNNWYKWNGTGWTAVAGDPRVLPAGGLVVGINPQLHSGTFDTAGQGFVTELGTHSIRLGIGHGDWNFGVNWAYDRGVEVLLMLGYGVSGQDVQTAGGRQAYADRAAATATTYGNKIKYYEVWNEWNGGFGLPCSWNQAATACVDHAMYVDLLCRTFNAVKAIQPSAIIVGGATAGVDTGFIGPMLDAGAGNCMDMLSVHPYVFTQTTYSVPSGSTATVGVDKFIEAMTAVHNLVLTKTGKDMKIAVTEDGRTDSNSSANYQRTADYITQLYARVKTIPFVEGIWWYELEDVPQDVQGYGLLTSSNVKKPAFDAFKASALP